MNPELSKLETELAGLHPAKLDESLGRRLEAALAGELGETPEELRGVEAELSGLGPAELPGPLSATLEGLLSEVRFPGDPKVVPFPGAAPAARPGGEAPRRTRRPWLAAAAAVALAGGLTALFVGPGDKAPSMVTSPDMGSSADIPVDGRKFVPASFGSDVSNAEDLGLVWSAQGEPMRVIRVVYEDEAEFSNSSGERLLMSAPRVEHIMIPEQID